MPDSANESSFVYTMRFVSQIWILRSTSWIFSTMNIHWKKISKLDQIIGFWYRIFLKLQNALSPWLDRVTCSYFTRILIWHTIIESSYKLLYFLFSDQNIWNNQHHVILVNSCSWIDQTKSPITQCQVRNMRATECPNARNVMFMDCNDLSRVNSAKL